jgi:hypothetical protein
MQTIGIVQAIAQNMGYNPDKHVVEMRGNEIEITLGTSFVRMFMSGRPDGRPSLLEEYLKRLDEYFDQHRDTQGFGLTAEECEALGEQLSQLNWRLRALMKLNEYALAKKDAWDSLQILDLCRDFALDEEQALTLESTRVYLIRMHASAEYYNAMEDGDVEMAFCRAKAGMTAIEGAIDPESDTAGSLARFNLNILEGFARRACSRLPSDSIILLRLQLRQAVKEERFEDALAIQKQLERRVGASHDTFGADLF